MHTGTGSLVDIGESSRLAGAMFTSIWRVEGQRSIGVPDLSRLLFFCSHHALHCVIRIRKATASHALDYRMLCAPDLAFSQRFWAWNVSPVLSSPDKLPRPSCNSPVLSTASNRPGRDSTYGNPW